MKAGRIPPVVKRNTMLLSVNQTLYTIVFQINVLLGAFMIIGLTGNVNLAGLGTGLAWGGRLIIAYQSGKLMDRLGRVRVLQYGTLLLITGSLLIGAFLVVENLPGVVAGLFVYGLGVGIANQNRVAVADMFPFSRRGEGLGYVLMASVVGAISAPLFLLVGTGLATLFGLENLSLQFMAIIWFTGTLLMIPPLILNNMVRPDPRLIAENLPQLYPDQDPPHNESSSRGPARMSLRLASYPVFAAFAVSGLAQGNMTMNMALVPFVLHSHDAALLAISVAVGIHFLGMYGLSVPLGRWADRFGRRAILVLGAAISGIGALVTPLFPSVSMIVVGIFLVGLGWSAATVASTALLSDLSGAKERGRLIGLNDVVLGGSALTFPLLGGVIIGVSGFAGLALFGLTASAPGLGVALLLKEPLIDATR